MSKKEPRPSARELDKLLVEAGLQCRKRLWIDYHRPAPVELTTSRRAMSEVGKQLLELARSVFPKGVVIASETASEAAEETRQQLEEGTPVLFGATFTADGVEVECDILVRHKDGAVDLYEIKSGTKIAQRYLNDLALQTHVLQASGFSLRAAFLLHQNPKYQHTEGTDYPPMQLLRSADVTSKVLKQVPHVAARLNGYRKTCASEKMPEQPMGTYCKTPSPCPHVEACSETAPKRPAYRLPELTRQQEMALQNDGLAELAEVDPQREGLTFTQRRTIESALQGQKIVEDFIGEELQHCVFPLHFLSIATITDALPRFNGQRPWRRTPYGWAVSTLYEDGRVETEAFAYTERDDPRLAVISPLAKHLEVGGTVICWDSTPVEGLRALLEDLPDAKVTVRAVVGRALCDMEQLFESGVFHPELSGHSDFAASVAALSGDEGGYQLAVQNEDNLRELLDKAWAPRVRTTTRQKIRGQIEESLSWRSERMLDLFREFSGIEPTTPIAKPPDASNPVKELPKLPEEA